MEIKLQKWGNSNGIRIPNSLLKMLDLKTNDKIDLTCDGKQIILAKKNHQRKLTTKERFENYTGGNLATEFEWDEPVGSERIWEEMN